MDNSPRIGKGLVALALYCLPCVIAMAAVFYSYADRALDVADDIRTVAGQGFAVDIDECEQGLACAAAPVHAADGRVTAALSVSAPSARVREEQLLREILPRVIKAADSLSRELGYQAP